MNLAEITDILQLLTDAMPRFTLRENTPEAYLTILGDMDAELVRNAALQYLSAANQFTPIPTPGLLRDEAIEIEMLAAGIPTAGEAYGMVLDGLRRVGPQFCNDGAALRNAIEHVPGEYQKRLWDYKIHVSDCKVCNTEPMQVLEYNHPLVAAVVRQLGGRDHIVTDNPMADRARFEDSYREIYMRERKKHAMLPEVRNQVETIRMQLDSGVDPVHLIDGQVGGLVGKFDSRGRADWQRRKDIQ